MVTPVMSPPSDAFFTQDIHALAKSLIGSLILLDDVGGKIVETEVYTRDDPASHSINGPRPRNAVMFGAPGRAYVYQIYGLHFCLNIVGGLQPGSAVLIRALEPVNGLDIMFERRHVGDARHLCSGPGRLCQALGVTLAHNGLPVTHDPFRLIPTQHPQDIVTGPRIGITKAAELPWRYGLRDSPFLSRPFKT